MAELIQGYVHQWYSQSETWKFAVAPYAFSWWCSQFGRVIPLIFRHQDNIVFASRRAGTLAIWSDSYGLGFEALVSTRHMAMIARDLMAGQLGCSMEIKLLRSKLGFLDGPYPRNATVDELVAKPLGELVTRCSLHEITVTDTPGFEATACWLASAGPYDLPRHVEELRGRWRDGRHEAERNPWPMSDEDRKDARRDEKEAAEKAAKVVPLRGGRGRAFALGERDPLLDCGWSRSEVAFIREQQRSSQSMRALLAGPPRKRRK